MGSADGHFIQPPTRSSSEPSTPSRHHYELRFYRDWTGSHLTNPLKRFNVTMDESDLELYVTNDISETDVQAVLADCRAQLSAQLLREPDFLESLVPLAPRPDDGPLAARMKAAAQLAGVGPMAAVAGTIAEAVGVYLRQFSPDVIVENGGDLYLTLSTERRVLVYAGDSPLSNRLALNVKPEDTPLGICTSSGRFGHSLSFGKAHAAVILSKNPALADAVATATANRVSTPEDIDAAVAFAAGIPGIKGVIVIQDDRMGLWGELDLKPVKG
ncbi:hypothetical protein SAMN03080599_01839 [Acidaminobacter hydrogenoformans DSM 2784]|uniref:Uncharacterized protein n=2 Tax=Acidaminobacter TaxID=65402 RepID=A0A1G5RZS1_9FIRM|nr:hypothetical protein SAMN03080599_01839 [Acidaminobacter hydrogenoformans DSM 2784]